MGKKTPPDFRFTLKANRQITHRKRLENVKSDVRYSYILANNLKEKLGCILFQLPPSLTLDLALLENFFQCLSPEFKNVIEFRHPSWYTEKIYDLMRGKHAVFCVVSSAKVPETPITTSETAYFRFHGLTGGFRHNYTEEELAKWAAVIKEARAQEFFIYFNNDYRAQAVFNCRTLGKLLSD